MKIAFLASECYPYVKAGGLADVTAALPIHLGKRGHQIKVFLPFYNLIDKDSFGIKKVNLPGNCGVNIGNSFEAFELYTAGEEVYFIKNERYYNRSKIYTDDNDEDERYIFFQYATLYALKAINWKPDIIHCNDWQTGLVPVILKKKFNSDSFYSSIRTVFTIHNIAYQGNFPKESLLKAGFAEAEFIPGGSLEFNGLFSFMKAGISEADVITTVSPTYACEIQTPEYGCGMEGVLQNRHNKLFGILNGIDDEVWNPAKDKYLTYKYTLENVEQKKLNKYELILHSGFNAHLDKPLIGIVSRLVWQKGFDYLRDIADILMQNDIMLVVLGEGEKRYEDFFKDLEKKYSKKVRVYLEFNDKLSHLITAGSDIFLMPSRYEPCGLNQMYSLKYGTLPIVRKTGGLADTVKDYDEYGNRANGFSFTGDSSESLLKKILFVIELFEDKEVWLILMKNGMQENFSWDVSARKYEEIYSLVLNNFYGSSNELPREGT
ncbi:MAG: glycogen synthase GlgA [Ignavibacteria bacterium]